MYCDFKHGRVRLQTVAFSRLVIVHLRYSFPKDEFVIQSLGSSSSNVLFSPVR